MQRGAAPGSPGILAPHPFQGENAIVRLARHRARHVATRTISAYFPFTAPHYRGPVIHLRSSMGKGDKRTRRGKTNRSSYGKTRKRKPKKKGKAPARAS